MSNKYHGQVWYMDGSDPSEFQKIVGKLPRRSDFIEKDVSLLSTIESSAPIFFRPNYVFDNNTFVEGHRRYQLGLIGVLKNGIKAGCLINGIRPYFEVRVPAGRNPRDFIDELTHVLNEEMSSGIKFDLETHIDTNGTKEFIFDVKQQRPFKLYQDELSDYIGIYSYTTTGRKRCIEYLRGLGYETANDDTSCYYRVVARQYKFPLCDWIQLRNYDRSYDMFRESVMPFTFIVDVNNITTPEALGIDFTKGAENRNYLKDNSMTMVWDLETHDFLDTGRAPQPADVENGTIFMDSCAFMWYHSQDVLLTVCFTTMPAPPRPDCLLVIVPSQNEIIMFKAILAGRMAPEFVVAFNDGEYDWPFIINRADKKIRNGIDLLKKHMTVFNANYTETSWMIKGPTYVDIKIEATKNMKYVHFDPVGYYCIDTKIIFQKLFPTSESNTLNYFLASNKLGSKVDMPIPTMNKIYRLMTALGQLYKTKVFADIKAAFDIDREVNGDNHCLFAAMAKVGGSSSTAIKTKKLIVVDPRLVISLAKMTMSEMADLMSQATNVVHYCNMDAIYCHKLLLVRNVIADKREMGVISYTSMCESLYRADGIRIRNLAISRALMPQWNIAASNITDGQKTDKKYPGAYVVPPKKGLYRDHVSIKRMRRYKKQKVNSANVLDSCFEWDEVNPTITPSIDEGDDGYVAPSMDNPMDENESSDRPCFGVDANSLYPNMIINYNLSPEKLITDQLVKDRLAIRVDPATGAQYKFNPVSFRYGLKDEPEENKELVEGWFVAQATDGRGMGLYPAILDDLQNMRKRVKKLMEYYDAPFKFLDAFKKKTTPPNDTKEACLAAAEAEIVREQELADSMAGRKNHGYFKYRVSAAKTVRDFIAKEWQVGQTLADLIAETFFWFNYYNSKQLAIKVFMNSFYGETGNTLSPFFMRWVAGGTTTYGQITIKTAKKFVEDDKSCPVLYGDTDSLYVCAPEHIFHECDAQYLSGTITKLQYWTVMVELSMEFADQLCADVNEFLFKCTGMRHVRMAYEEVLWPYALLGRKKYIGIQHVGMANFSICMPNCSLKEFMESKLLFIRGLEVKKRGSSEILKIATYEVMKAAFCIENVDTLQQIVHKELRIISERPAEPKLFIKTGQYKKPAPGKPGNVVFNIFVDRMNKIDESYPNIGIKAPELSERFRYVVVKRYPWIYDVRGRKSPLKKGNRIEYYHAMDNDEYNKIMVQTYGERLEIDRDSYIRDEIIGQFARFMTYHPDYDLSRQKQIDAGQYTELGEDDGDDIDIDDKVYDKQAHGYAKSILLDIFENEFAYKYEDKGSTHKLKFKEANIISDRVLRGRYGSASYILGLVNPVMAKASDTKSIGKLRAEVRDRIRHVAEKTGNAMADTHIKDMLCKSAKTATKIKKYTPFQAGSIYRRIAKRRNTYIDYQMSKELVKLDELMGRFEKLCISHNDLLKYIINKGEDMLGGDDDDDEEDGAVPDEFADLDESTMNDVFDIYINLSALYSMRESLKRTEAELDYYQSQSVGHNVAPPGITVASERDNFMQWLSKNAMKDN